MQDWAGNEDRTSVSGKIITVGGALVSWKSSKQKYIALSSTEAEYVSLSEASREVAWLRNLLSSVGYKQDNPTPVFQDNTGSIIGHLTVGISRKVSTLTFAYITFETYVYKR